MGMQKAIAALLSAAVVFLAQFIPAVAEIVTPEIINAISVLAGGLGAYLAPNKIAGENVASLAKEALERRGSERAGSIAGGAFDAAAEALRDRVRR